MFFTGENSFSLLFLSVDDVDDVDEGCDMLYFDLVEADIV